MTLNRLLFDAMIKMDRSRSIHFESPASNRFVGHISRHLITLTAEGGKKTERTCYQVEAFHQRPTHSDFLNGAILLAHCCSN